MSEDDEAAPSTRPANRKRARCPVCGKPQVARHRPFCSERCATIDLARWLGGSYRIPVEEQPQGDEDTDEYDPYKDIDD